VGHRADPPLHVLLRADLERDPLLVTARWLVAAGLRTAAQLTADEIPPSDSKNIATYAIADLVW